MAGCSSPRRSPCWPTTTPDVRSVPAALSGIALTSERIGYEAVALWIGSCKAAGRVRCVLIEPTSVIERQSTDTLAMEDRDLARAVAFIRQHAGQPIQVADVLREVPLSRRQFERRFQAVLGRTPAAEIRRAHVERAKQLLLNTDLSIPQVAYAAGFASREYLTQVFTKETGISPCAIVCTIAAVETRPATRRLVRQD